ncbi:Abhydrolase-2 domain-containing protein [Favolaschia claudopus]|uniref:Acyl-protein thioesterase 1 n=1 Tax=Favolaschia claudopus TaxID=2862362 RepID=A0AAW0C3I0_9AGAR
MADNTPNSTSPSRTKLKQLIWPEPLVIPPTGPHTHTIILLHGRGSNAERFGLELLKSQSSDNGKTLAAHFSGLKFIFPTAKKRRARIYSRTPINQWFDHILENGSSFRNEQLQYEGIRETSAFVHSLILQEAELVGVDRVILGGLSQGCAAALHVLLNFQPNNGSLGGFVGMSGWLPFVEMFVDNEEEDRDDTVDQTDLQISALNTARDIASLSALDPGKNQAPAFAHTPILLGHGIHDEKVSITLGEHARDVLQHLGCKTQWKAYDEGHWYKVPDQINDMVVWLKSCMNI